MLVPLLQSQVPPPLSIRRVIWIWRWDKDSLAVRRAGGMILVPVMRGVLLWCGWVAIQLIDSVMKKAQTKLALL